MIWFKVFCEECESGDELTTNGSVTCSRGVNEFYCVCVILGYGQTDKGYLRD
jgi:hypothetical protein